MDTKNYTKDKNGLQKMRGMLGNTKIVMMATNLGKIPFSARPMTLQQMDEKGDLWFFAARDSDIFKDIENDNRVQIIVSNESEQRYISVFGNAVHVVDNEKVDELWNPALRTWFDGKNDPNMVLLNMNMENAQYWDSKSNKLVDFFEMAKTTISEQTGGTGEKGHINLQNH